MNDGLIISEINLNDLIESGLFIDKDKALTIMLREGQRYLLNSGPNSGMVVVALKRINLTSWEWKFENKDVICYCH